MKKQTLGIIRHLLTFGGGYLAGQNWIDPALLPELIGSITSIIGIIWSVAEKKS